MKDGVGFKAISNILFKNLIFTKFIIACVFVLLMS
jgi:hypothetical protein